MAIIDRLSPRYASIDVATSGSTSLVAARTGKRILVLSYVFVSAGTVAVKFQSASTDLTGAMSMVANGERDGAYSEAGHFQTNIGEALQINLNANVQVSGHLTWVEV